MIDIYSRDPLNQFSDNIIGWQVKPRYTKEAILEYPFESMIGLKGAYPRLVILDNFESLSSNPDLIKLASLDEGFGCYPKWLNN